MEGVLWYPNKAKGPAQPGQIPVRRDAAKEIDNVLVPVAMFQQSHRHIGAAHGARLDHDAAGRGPRRATAVQSRTDAASIDPDALPKKLNIKTEP